MNALTQRAHFAPGTVILMLTVGLTACGGGGGGSSKTAASTTPTQPVTTTQPGGTAQPTPASPTAVPGNSSGSAAATVQWAAPQTKSDGTVLNDLAGFTIVYGSTPSDLSQSIRIDNPSIDTYVVEQLPAGTYYFGVKAHDSMGAESETSNIMTKVIG